MIKHWIREEKYISIVGGVYVSEIVTNFLPKIFDTYKLNGDRAINFQVSVHENTFSTASILLTVVNIESYIRRIFYFEKSREFSCLKISKIFQKKNPSFPEQSFLDILSEVFVIRDIIVHNHVYDIRTKPDDAWNIISCTQNLAIGNPDKKHKNCIDNEFKSKILRLNAQPLKIGFEDLFTVLAIFDLFVNLSKSMLGNGYVPFNFAHKFNDQWEDNFSKIMAHYYWKIQDKGYINFFNKLFSKLRKEYLQFISNREDSILENSCPKCETFGFKNIRDINGCPYCKFKIT